MLMTQMPVAMMQFGSCSVQHATVNYKFTGKERDSESNLDYFGSRHYGSAFGRFIQPDEPFADQDTGDPQSWNMYGYARNNPLRYTDPTGNACVQGSDGKYSDDNSGGETCAQVEENNKNAQASATVTATAPTSQEMARADSINPGFLGPFDVFFIRVPELGLSGLFGRLFGSAAGKTAAETAVKTFGEGITKVGQIMRGHP